MKKRICLILLILSLSSFILPVFANDNNSNTTKPIILAKAFPKYPEEAKQKRYEGVVKLKISISEDGLPEEVKVIESSGYEILDNAAVESVKKWKFAPATKDNIPIESSYMTFIKFSLSD